ncbi:MAG: hypothetical protein HY360_06445 [Verrucomicrobia bacterium]|nr:hypothetical protein [Verrucomicrobiota bacterium]
MEISTGYYIERGVVAGLAGQSSSKLPLNSFAVQLQAADVLEEIFSPSALAASSSERIVENLYNETTNQTAGGVPLSVLQGFPPPGQVLDMLL